MNLSTLPDRRAAQHPSAPALADDDVELDNTGFLEAVRRAAGALRAHGVGAGDVVAVMLPNTVDLVVALFAAWRLGAAVTPLNPALVPDEVGYQVADAGAAVLVAAGPLGFDVDVPVVLPVRELSGDVTADPVDVPADALALLIYTSGTTGRPKGVMLDHANLNAMCAMMIGQFALTAADRSLLVLPLFHVNGIVVSTLSPLLVGASTTIAGRFSAQTFFDRLVRSGATYFSAVPTIYAMLADLPADVRPDTSAVRFAICGAAPASVELLERFESRYGIPIVEGYGLSEGTCASTVNPLERRKPGTVGLPLPGQRVRIVDADGADVGPGEAGEVLISGPNIMRGYLGRPAETARTLVDGWLRTGDIGRFDEDGYLVLVDRAKDMIIRGGENIYPKEIEAVAYQLPEIATAAVIGRAHPVYGEEPVLYVALNAGAHIDEQRIRTHLSASLSKYKVPVEITILDELPANAVGKLDKPKLRQLVLDADR
ncbi:class I adenylate-forming enzyme family protein [Nocardia cyriacigeorgica]|uniref:class I adenylate-forming enzyme family protein n=1 Tax=Nocardia cyriacigeorgica TaxID=135487 RepID=UPI0013CFD078|nr:AMP-binding protein [Nocardia cyriacigeorgica]NEW26675.1 long-chain fatty acid--CoA ligase [Nocardia cyriacigeorgica]